jgi:thioredoxin-like negative regulator of GroEL
VPTRTPRMEQFEALLADEPTDPFLRYSLALEHASAGDDPSAADQLLRLVADTPYVPAFLMAGQILNRLTRVDEAVSVLRRGIEAAKAEGNGHAEGEMAGLLATIE